ncbi:hypothetical protein HOY82DRAFT_544101 [Tuber indicum]|nr:hypothetical protein HOY82DRAFT_544101 [Tuber indicum]
MGRAAGVPPRSEDGNRDMAELLHARMNTILHCPSCGYHDSNRGTFNKDIAGKADKDGRRYRRFICRSNVRCGRSLSVTDFIKLCDHPRLSGSCDSYPAAQISSKLPENSFQHILTELQDLRETVNQEKSARIHLESQVAKLLAVADIPRMDKPILNNVDELQGVVSPSPDIRAIQVSKSEIDQELILRTPSPHFGNGTDITEFQVNQLPSISTVSIEQNSKLKEKETGQRSSFASVAGRSQYSLQQSASVSSGSAHKQVGGECEGNCPQSEDESPLERAEVQPRSASAAIYVSGVPFLPIREVKRLLAQKPVGIQIRHVRNIS